MLFPAVTRVTGQSDNLDPSRLYNPVMTSHQILARHQHRPWPLPRRPWVMRQEWNRLLFAHWSLDPAQLRPPMNLPSSFTRKR